MAGHILRAGYPQQFINTGELGRRAFACHFVSTPLPSFGKPRLPWILDETRYALTVKVGFPGFNGKRDLHIEDTEGFPVVNSCKSKGFLI
ncbi:hypothetical protein [Brevibacillus massiliensis]|uniref:hypothetical protein n=1 Tax=Brevibacillus massiliensis TaxID=1118054 RepID=UPI0036F1D9F4